MRTLHALALLSFLVLGAATIGSYERGAMSAWQALLLTFGGALLPYVVALGFALLVAPPNFHEMWQDFRRSRGRRPPPSDGTT